MDESHGSGRLAKASRAEECQGRCPHIRSGGLLSQDSALVPVANFQSFVMSEEHSDYQYARFDTSLATQFHSW